MTQRPPVQVRRINRRIKIEIGKNDVLSFLFRYLELPARIFGKS